MEPYLYSFWIHEFNLNRLAPNISTLNTNMLIRVEVTNTEFNSAGYIAGNTAKFTIGAPGVSNNLLTLDTADVDFILNTAKLIGMSEAVHTFLESKGAHNVRKQ